MRIALITAHSPQAAAVTDAQRVQPVSLARALAARGHRVTVYARRDRSDCPRTTILGRGASIEHVTAGPPKPLPDSQAARYSPVFAGYLADRWRVRPVDAHADWPCRGMVPAAGMPTAQVPACDGAPRSTPVRTTANMTGTSTSADRAAPGRGHHRRRRAASDSRMTASPAVSLAKIANIAAR